MDFLPISFRPAALRVARLRPTLLGVGLLTLGLAACKKDADTSSTPTVGTILYVENNLAAGNAILAYRQQADGSLVALAGSPFATGGAGFANPTQTLGPDDTDEPLTLSADKKRLFAVNQGSSTISVFNIGADGVLTPVSGSPFPSGGLNPCSLGLANDRLYVVNKSDDGNPATTDPAPTYTVFNIAGSGALTPLPNSTVAATVGTSPTHAYVAPSQRLLFTDEFLAPLSVGTLHAFTIGSDGRLTSAAGSPVGPPPATNGGPTTTQGIWSHPTQNVLYVGLPLQAKVAVYSYDGTTGALTYRSSVDAGLKNGLINAICWLRTNKAGTRLYTLNSGEGTVSVFDVTTPLTPTQIQVLPLKKLGPTFGPVPQVVTSAPFHLTFSPDEQTLFVVSQHLNPDFSTNYNYIHALRIGTDGKLSEPTEPVQPPVPATARPQGAVSVTL